MESLRFGALLFSSVAIIIIFEGVHGHEYGCSRLDDMLLNHNHYIKAVNVCSAPCSILHVSRDIIALGSLRRQIND